MDEMLMEDYNKCLEINSDVRSHNIKTLAAQLALENDSLKDFMKKFDENKGQLIQTLRDDNDLQKSAVISILEKSDASSWEIKKQILFIENKLAELTRLELAKRKLESDSQVVELSKNRVELTKMLMDLIERQENRRKELIQMIQKMEAIQAVNTDSNDYWLRQYEFLLHSKSYDLVKFLESVDSNLVYEFFINGVFQYLPLLKDVDLRSDKLNDITANTLIKVGINNSEDRSSILKAIRTFLNSNQVNVPSAPEIQHPSAPILEDDKFIQRNNAVYTSQEDCVVCFDAKSNVLFSPCGHICCCFKCSRNISNCPLCREFIKEKIQMN
ncbi:ubiquitin ligase protein LRSAM1, putative [Pediculus humanus corporis]|uniref:Ubiquitin ligase protein LRSAM1, putative n=1 Tax=Pediculus humanus subsp. corporis TaxID=121224 RepID=E0VW76_PEDHC|nr:ubiquitin ligase protein LRSAM1, putative [Pediculus humanus corporis]EEB17632.1 ubiquitin ligase protein LRSAM1, putative [Pediculus humanus corporis]